MLPPIITYHMITIIDFVSLEINDAEVGSMHFIRQIRQHGLYYVGVGRQLGIDFGEIDIGHPFD